MPTGTITDPRLNQNEKDYGILVDLSSGYNYYYLKDDNCQYLTHGTPVIFEIKTISINEQGHPYDLVIAYAVKVDPKEIGKHPVHAALNMAASGAVRKNTGGNRGDKGFVLQK